MKALTLTTTRRRKSTVILTGLDLSPKYSTNLFADVSKMIAALFSTTAMGVALTAVTLLMWMHIATIDNTNVLETRLGMDALLFAPWAVAYVLRQMKKGGKR